MTRLLLFSAVVVLLAGCGKKDDTLAFRPEPSELENAPLPDCIMQSSGEHQWRVLNGPCQIPVFLEGSNWKSTHKKPSDVGGVSFKYGGKWIKAPESPNVQESTKIESVADYYKALSKELEKGGLSAKEIKALVPLDEKPSYDLQESMIDISKYKVQEYRKDGVYELQDDNHWIKISTHTKESDHGQELGRTLTDTLWSTMHYNETTPDPCRGYVGSYVGKRSLEEECRERNER